MPKEHKEHGWSYHKLSNGKIGASDESEKIRMVSVDGGETWVSAKEFGSGRRVFLTLTAVAGLSAFWALIKYYFGDEEDNSADATGSSTSVGGDITPVSTVPYQEIQNESSGTMLPSSFPESITQWSHLIVPYAKKYGLPPELIAAVILVESNGNPNAVSKYQACGLMQVVSNENMSVNSRGERYFINRPSCEKLFDPEFNIEYGTRYLANLINNHRNKEMEMQQAIREGLFNYGPSGIGFMYADKVLAVINIYAPQGE